MTPNYLDILYFLEVAATGNLSRAAERLGIAQPSLSAAMKRLEEAVDATLLLRSRTGVQLTKAGMEFAHRGRLVLLQWDQLRTEIKKRETSISGQYILGCHPSVALYTLSGFLPALMQDHPDLELKLVHDLSRKIVEQVIRFEIDFGLVINPVRHPDLVILTLCTDEVLFWTASPPSSTQVIDPGKGVLLCDPDMLQTQWLLQELKKRHHAFRRIVASGNLEVVTELTAAGAGVGLLPARVATRPGRPTLIPLSGQDLPVFRDTLCLVYRADAQKTKSAETIVRAIRQSLANPGNG
ncbi:MAG: LysR family transcriptional regulator [bacterium]|jgi:DNA-binding transcriptional LysR family regulator|nr:LysR family transcriptional regulator [bacterium]